MMPTWKKNKGKTSNSIGAESNNWNEREGNQQHGMDRQGRMKKENKTLGTENVKTLKLCTLLLLLLLLLLSPVTLPLVENKCN